MVCHKCGTAAIGICRFCGRAVCQEHAVQKPYILSIYVPQDGIPRALAVGGALFCATCQPQSWPIKLPELQEREGNR